MTTDCHYQGLPDSARPELALMRPTGAMEASACLCGAGRGTGAEAEHAAVALCRIASGDADSKSACLQANAVPALVVLLSSTKGH